MTKPLSELLNTPEELLALSDEELKILLAPYFPQARTAVLPEDKSSKFGLEMRVLNAALADPKMAKMLEEYKRSMKK